MPRIVRAYACEYNCRRKTTTRRADILRHEKTCKKNPIIRACPTCKYQQYYPGDDGDYLSGYGGSPGYWWCEIYKLPEGRHMVRNCSAWEKAGKGEGGNANGYHKNHLA